MPAPATEASVARTGETLRFAGALRRDAVAALWKPALAALPGARGLDLQAVDALDSAGLALLSELSARAEAPLAIIGDPPGLSELRAAYRLTPQLAFARA